VTSTGRLNIRMPAFAVFSAGGASQMSERRQRRWSWWVGKGAVAMATLAALSLAVMVYLARRALDGASDVLIRGDGSVLVNDVIADLWQIDPPVTSASLAPLLATHAAAGLRYVALVDARDHHVLAQAGTVEITKPFELPSELDRREERARLINGLARYFARPGASERMPGPRPLMVVEFESPVLRRLHGELTRISVVAAGAALVLIAFAFAWSKTMSRLSALQQQAEGERQLVALGRASSVLAHEIRNPIAALKGHAQLLVEDLAGPPRAKAERVVDLAERLERLTGVLLDFVRDAPLDVQAVTPAHLVDRALPTLPKERVRVDLTSAPETLDVDVERLRLALRNLIQNGLQASAEGAEPVEVRLFGKTGEVVIEVRDHGPGLAPGAAAHMFDPFVTTKAKGTGLGLAIARRVVEQHGGTLTGETHGEGGAVFRMVLPLVSKPASAA
jgi:two-component system, NtrC family, sensor histidine kinase HydH